MQIDAAAMAAQYVAIERQPYGTRYSNQTKLLESRISGWNAISKAMTDFSTAATALTKAGQGFNGTQGRVNEEGFLRVTTGAGAATGRHEVLVQQLAQAQQSSINLGSGGTLPASGSLTLTSQQGETLTLDMATLNDGNPPTAQQLADAINQQGKSLGVGAAVMRGSNGESHLVLTSDKTGEVNGFSLSGSSELDGVLAQNKTLSAAQDALVTYGGANGIEYRSASNQIESMIAGVTLNLTKVQQAGDDPLVIEIGADSEALMTGVKGFVDSYNTLIDLFNTQAGTREGALYANGTARGMLSNIKQIMRNQSGDISLVQLGMSTDSKTGKLTLDEKKFNTLMETNPDEVANMFSDMSRNLETQIKEYTRTGGTIYNTKDSLTRSKESVARNVANLDRRMENQYQRYLKEFTAMNAAMNQMNNSSMLFY
ncbi:MAG: flagellar filament capping protein FliD [Aeromonas sobria]